MFFTHSAIIFTNSMELFEKHRISQTKKSKRNPSRCEIARGIIMLG